MKTRMQPIGNIWNRFPRVVRDLAITCGKEVQLEMEGKETELDKTIIEAIKDPLTHIVRNSVDHGIETPEVRSPRANRPRAACSCVLFMKAARSTSRLSMTAPASTSSASKRKPSSAALFTRPGRPHERTRRRPPDLSARILDGGKNHQCLRPRRRHGRGQNQHRKDRRHGGHAKSDRHEARRSRSRFR